VTLIWKAKPDLDLGAEEEFATIFRALGHKTRLHIVRTVLERDRCLCGDLAQELSIAQSTASQHLRVLEEAGVLSADAEGPRRWYRLRSEPIARIRAFLAGLKSIS
jgi:ArsR family transcriptional regulator